MSVDVKELNYIRLAQFVRLRDTSFRTVFVSSILLVLISIVQTPVANDKFLLPWVIIGLSINSLRIVVCRYYQTHIDESPDIIEFRLALIRVGVILSSTIWGISPYFVLGRGYLEQELFVTYVLTGLSSGAVVSYAIDKASALAYVIFTIAPLMVSMLLLGDTIHLGMSFAGAIYMIFTIYSIIKFNESLLNAEHLQYQANQREAEIKKIAFNDPLTGLSNRRLFMENLHHAFSLAKRAGRNGALIFIDIDHFKQLNDTHGHGKGDLLLKQIAERLSQSVRESDTVSRFGGDEFVVMIENLSRNKRTSVVEAERFASSLMQSINLPYQLGDLTYRVTASLGVAMFDGHHQSHEELLKDADVAMYQAKRAGRNKMVLYDSNKEAAK
jgi:diguanylate cyclase (GGDEF)-like protein